MLMVLDVPVHASTLCLPGAEHQESDGYGGGRDRRGANGAITDLDGNFSLDWSKGTNSIQVSYVGYKTKTVTIPSSGKVTIQMESDENMLQETVVIGYGVQRKGDLTGSVSNVSSKDFNQGVIN